MGKDRNKKVEETNTTGGSASFTPGVGINYATPKAFSKGKGKYSDGGVYKKWGYKLVPKKIKGSGLEVKQLNEDESKSFQQDRIDDFDKIEKELDNIIVILSNAKNETVEYYNHNPASDDPVYPTRTILSYVGDIKKLLNRD